MQTSVSTACYHCYSSSIICNLRKKRTCSSGDYSPPLTTAPSRDVLSSGQESCQHPQTFLSLSHWNEMWTKLRRSCLLRCVWGRQEKLCTLTMLDSQKVEANFPLQRWIMTLQVFTLDCKCLHLTEIVLQSAVFLMDCRTSDTRSHFLHANSALPADSTMWEHRGYIELPECPWELL